MYVRLKQLICGRIILVCTRRTILTTNCQMKKQEERAGGGDAYIIPLVLILVLALKKIRIF